MRSKTIRKISGWLKRGTTFLVGRRSCGHWLLFEKEATFREFLEAFPHHGLDERLAKIAAEREALTADLDRRLHRRDFDLSRVGDEQQRTNLARRYVETTDKIRLLEIAKGLAVEWEDRL